MKLKKANKIAKKRGYKWIVVNSLDCVIGYKKEPFIETSDNDWGIYLSWPKDGKFIGTYSGDKWWTNTKRKVK